MPLKLSSSQRVSLVIPAYNEENGLSACLEAIAAQTVKPFEVIVVDNNSTDNTAAIARSFNFVRVVHETKRGVENARNKGFDSARGDIIGRIDVDTILPSDWVAKVQTILANPGVHGVTGSISFNDIPLKDFLGRIELFFRSYMARNLARRDEMFLLGSNMAIKRGLWLDVRSKLCHNHHLLHEDLDLAAHAAHSKWKVIFDKELNTVVSARRIDSSARAFYPYVIANSRTYGHHGLRGRFYMYPVIWLVLIFYPLLRLLYRSYDISSDSVSLTQLFRTRAERVSPVSDPLTPN